MKKLLYIFLILAFIACEKESTTATSTPTNNGNNNNGTPIAYEMTVTLTAGSYPGEISWEIADPSPNGIILWNGGAPCSETICIPEESLGDLEFRMYDSAEDGWDGSTFTLSGNTTLSGTTTGTLLEGNYGVETFNITGGATCDIPEPTLTGDWEGTYTGDNDGYWYANVSSDGPNFIIDGVLTDNMTGVQSNLGGTVSEYGTVSALIYYDIINPTTGEFIGELAVENNTGYGSWTNPLNNYSGNWQGSKVK